MKQIFKLTYKCILVLAPVWGIMLFARFNLEKFADEEAPYYFWNKEMTTTKQDTYYDVVIFGDSGANAAFAPEVLSDSTLNLAMGGTTPVENYYSLKEYLENNDAPETIYLSFGDEHFTGDAAFYYRTMYAHRFKLEDVLEIVNAARVYNQTDIATSTWKHDVLGYTLYFPSKYITSILNANFVGREETNKQVKELVNSQRGRYISLTDVTNSYTDEVYLEDFYIYPLFEDYYYRILDLCQEKGINVRLIKIPADENVVFSDTYIETVNNYYAGLEERYPNVTFDWIMESAGHDYYSDIYHMNNNGAMEFSQRVKELHSEDFGE